MSAKTDPKKWKSQLTHRLKDDNGLGLLTNASESVVGPNFETSASGGLGEYVPAGRLGSSIFGGGSGERERSWVRKGMRHQPGVPYSLLTSAVPGPASSASPWPPLEIQTLRSHHGL